MSEKQDKQGLPEAIRRIEEAKRTNLTTLDLSGLALAAIPDALAQLINLQSLNLSNNQLTAIPAGVAQLVNLQIFVATGSHITTIPDWIPRLKHLRALHLTNNQITTIPDQIQSLGNLKSLWLDSNRITAVPQAITKLAKLEYLDLGDNEITALPDGLDQLLNLQVLVLEYNQITRIPDTLGGLAALQVLDFGQNLITTIPESFAELTALEICILQNNQLTSVPNSLTKLKKLHRLEFDGNPLPDELFAALKRGIPSFFRYLRSTKNRKVYPRTVKLVLLGEPKAGKTTLVEALKGNMEPCDEKREETLGVNVVSIEKAHPTDYQPMYLSAWDFAGQHIEHATHQFFLTENAIYLILWNARLGTESGRRDLWYWLELLKMRVREPKFLLVATHTEHTPPDLNLSEIERNYKGCQGNLHIELKTLSGFAALEEKVLALAAESPSLRAEWPPEWLQVRDEVRKIRQEQPYMMPTAFRSLLKKNGVAKEDGQKDLIGQLHTLGEILYHQERDELSSLVILNPEWVTELIAVVVRSKEAREHGGMLLKTDLDKLWKKAKLAPKVRDHLISLMDWFDLTYATGKSSEPGIVVEALPYSTPDDLKRIELPAGQPHMEMIFRFPSLQRHLPPGIPTWGIARAHRLAKSRPWRDAAVFEDSETNSHAVILASNSAKEVRLRVAADYPPFFFGRLEAILRDTFKRYPGAEPERRLPCPCQPECPTSYLYETVLKRWQGRKPYVTCDKSGEDISVESLLSGATRPDTEEGLRAMHADMRRLFTEHLRALNEQMENTCPSVFTLLPSREFTQLDTWIESMAKEAELELRLYCEHDSGWHETAHSVYRFRGDQKWFGLVKEGWNRFAGITKYVGPLVKTAGKLSKVLPLEVSGMALEKLPEAFSLGTDTLQLGKKHEKELVDIETRYRLKELIEHLDQQRGNTKPKNGGLHPWLIDDGRLLWLCPDHLKQYRPRA